MIISVNDPEYAVDLDVDAYEAFCDTLGITQKNREMLSIFFEEQLQLPPGFGPDTSAYVQVSSRFLRMYIQTREKTKKKRSLPALNKSVLHETRHVQKFCTQGHIYDDPEEVQIPHGERPSELDAEAFAATHQHCCFVREAIPVAL